MRLTTPDNYAVRNLDVLRRNDAPLSGLADIARAYAVSELFLFKIRSP